MKTWHLIVLALSASVIATIACSSSSSSFPTCKNPTNVNSACQSCTELNCGSEVAAVESTCAGYLACYEDCECSDEACINSCFSSAPATCTAVLESSNCSACASECTVTVTVTSNVPTATTPAAGVAFPDGIELGEPCSGDVYAAATTGYVFCDGGVWAYTTTDPALDGYSLYTGGSTSIVVPSVSTPPSGVVFPDGFVLGGACDGDVYVAASTGYLFCDDGVWAYTTSDPADDGYTVIADVGDDDGGTGFDAGSDDGGFGDDAGVDDAGTGEDAGLGDTGAGDAATG